MKTTIFYFTGTGNSLAVARSIAEKLYDCSLKPIAAYQDVQVVPINSENVGFVYPLYFHRAPKIVERFLKKTSFFNTKYIFAIITKGIPMVGYAMKQLNNILIKKNLSLNLGKYIFMPSYTVHVMNVPNRKKENKVIAKAEKGIQDIVASIQSQKNFIASEPFAFMQSSIESGRMFHSMDDMCFYTDHQCQNCGVCEQVCPVNNIRMNNGKPVWLGHCENCLACINFCPQKAIQYNKKTVKNERGHNPAITLKDIISQTTS